MTRESRDPLSVLRDHRAQLCVETPEDQAHRDAMDEAIAQVEALAEAARPCAAAYVDGIPTRAEIGRLVETLQPFTPTDSEGGGNG